MPQELGPPTGNLLKRVRDEVMKNLMQWWHDRGEEVNRRIHNEAQAAKGEPPVP